MPDLTHVSNALNRMQSCIALCRSRLVQHPALAISILRRMAATSANRQ